MTVLAVGDSLVHAEDSWAAWLARAMDRPLRRVSANGARSGDVLDQPAGLAGERCHLACLSVGSNDVIFDWDAEVFGQRLGRIVADLGSIADRVVVHTLTPSLGRFPGTGPSLRRRVDQANAAIRGCGALVITGDDLTGRRLLQPDRIHPTLEGQLLLADRAAVVLGVTPAPSSLSVVPVGSARWAYHRVALGQAPRRLTKRVLGRPFYR